MFRQLRKLGTAIKCCFAILVSCSFMTFEANAQGVSDPPVTADEWNAQTNGGTVRIITKGLGYTCSAIASDMSRVLNNIGQMRVLPVLGHGSLQGMADVIYLNGIDLSIVQSDVLAYIDRNNIHSNIKSRVRYVTKLYNSELHLVAGPDIKTVQDLRGKVVSYGVKGRGAFITAQNVFDSVGVEVRPVYLERDVAIEKVQKGEIAAVFVVTGKPAASIQRVKPMGGIHLLPIEFSLKFAKSYFPTKLTHEEYPNLIPEGQEIPTISVGEVLVVYNVSPNTDRYKKLERFVNNFFDNFSEFQKPIRHPKWKEVNLATVLPGWTRFAPAEVKLKQVLAVQRTGSNQDERAQFESFLKNNLGRHVSEQEKAEMYKKYKEWLQQQR